MSRSLKKPIRKDKTNHSWYNRKFRRINKQLINNFNEPKLMKEIVNSYDISDWKLDMNLCNCEYCTKNREIYKRK